MALQVISDNSKIGAGTQVTLGANDDAFVMAGVMVASTDGVGISSSSSNQNVNVQGTVVGETLAIDLGISNSTGQHLTIGENGYAGNSTAANAAVLLRGTGHTVDNAGTIDGEAIGLEMRGGTAIFSSTINNSGLIEAADYGVFRDDTVMTNSQRIVFDNTGEVRTAGGIAYYSNFHFASDIITNGGLMVGHVVLGDGMDTYNGTGGRVVGDVNGGDDEDSLYGGGFVDKLFGGAGNDGILGGGGDDLLEGGTGQDTMLGDDGNDLMWGGSDKDDLRGGTGRDDIDGDAGQDTIFGGADDDGIFGDADDDTLNGEAGNDNMDGGAGKDTMSGGTGDDQVNGGADSDTMSGDTGNDTLNGGAGIDTMDGGAGNDTFTVDNIADVVIDFGGGIDTVLSSFDFNLASPADAKGSVEKLSLIGTGNTNGTGNALANTLIGNIGNNTLKAGAGNDVVIGGNGNDKLFGEAGNDVLNGGAGTDRLAGGQGKDIMTGGTQVDQFVFDTKPNSLLNRDTVTDFQHGVDKMLIENALFTGIGGNGGLKADFFHVGTAAHDADDRIVYNKATGVLSYDADGTGAQAAVQFAVLANKAVLTASDFLVI